MSEREWICEHRFLMSLDALKENACLFLDGPDAEKFEGEYLSGVSDIEALKEVLAVNSFAGSNVRLDSLGNIGCIVTKHKICYINTISEKETRIIRARNMEKWPRKLIRRATQRFRGH